MNKKRKSTFSQEEHQQLEALRQAICRLLQKKRRLGEYAVTRKVSKPVVSGEGAPGSGKSA